MRPLPGDVLRLPPRFPGPDLLPGLPCSWVPSTGRDGAANARHQSSDEGRRDHRDHVRAWRRRGLELLRASVTDTGPQKLASSAKWAEPTAPIPPISAGPASGGEGEDDDQVHGDVVPFSGAQPYPRDDRDRRDHASGAARNGPSPASARSAEPPGRPGSVARPGSPRCCLCGRVGRYLLLQSDRRIRLRSSTASITRSRWSSDGPAPGAANGSSGSVTFEIYVNSA